MLTIETSVGLLNTDCCCFGKWARFALYLGQMVDVSE